MTSLFLTCDSTLPIDYAYRQAQFADNVHAGSQMPMLPCDIEPLIMVTRLRNLQTDFCSQIASNVNVAIYLDLTQVKDYRYCIFYDIDVPLGFICTPI